MREEAPQKEPRRFSENRQSLPAASPPSCRRCLRFKTFSPEDGSMQGTARARKSRCGRWDGPPGRERSSPAFSFQRQGRGLLPPETRF